MRLLALGLVFAGAAMAMPSTGILESVPGGAGSGSDTTTELVSSFSGPDRRLVARGRAAAAVGTTAPLLDYEGWSGAKLPLTGTERPVILLFAEPDCADCAPEIAKLSALSVVYFEDIYAVVSARAGTKTAVKRILDESSGGGLLLGGEDVGDLVAKGLGVKVRPSTAIIGPKGTVDAVWSEPVPLSVFYTFLQKAYGLKRD